MTRLLIQNYPLLSSVLETAVTSTFQRINSVSRYPGNTSGWSDVGRAACLQRLQKPASIKVSRWSDKFGLKQKLVTYIDNEVTTLIWKKRHIFFLL